MMMKRNMEEFCWMQRSPICQMPQRELKNFQFQCFLAAPSISAERRREIISHLANLDVKVSTLPSLSEIMSAKTLGSY